MLHFGSITEQKKAMSKKDVYKNDGSFLDELLKCYSHVFFEKLYNNKIYLNPI